MTDLFKYSLKGMLILIALCACQEPAHTAAPGDRPDGSESSLITRARRHEAEIRLKLAEMLNTLRMAETDTFLRNSPEVEALTGRLESLQSGTMMQGYYLILKGSERYYIIDLSDYSIAGLGKYKDGNNPLDRGFRAAASANPGMVPVIFVVDEYPLGILFDESYPSIIAIGLGAMIKPKDPGQGFVFRNHSRITVAGFIFKKCSGEKGGGVAVENGNVFLLLNCFNQNQASKYGGGLYSCGRPGRQPLIWMNYLSKNSAPCGGGAALADDTSTVFCGNIIENNQAGQQGGGAFLSNCALNLFFGNYLRENTVSNGQGGGMAICHSKGSIVAGNYISANGGAMNGGGVAFTGDTNAMHVPVLLSCNLISDNGAFGRGGGIYAGGDQEAVMIGNQISGNGAAKGGGVFLNATNLLTQVSGNRILDNTAVHGGGLYAYNTLSVLFANRILSNHADSCGGGMLLMESPNYSKSNLFGNNSGREGGGVYTSGNASPHLSDNYFTSNNAIDGGGMHISNGNCPDLHENKFSSNNAADYGGAIYITGTGTNPQTGSMNFFLHNTAEKGGGIYYDDFSGPLICGNIFRDNIADEGGAVVIHSADGSISGNEFIFNKAIVHGGAIHLDPGFQVTLSNNVFKNNIAGYAPPSQPLSPPGETVTIPGRGGAFAGFGPASMVTVTGNQFDGNVSMLSDGGAVALEQIQGQFSGNLFVSNIAAFEGTEGSGGAVFLKHSRVNFSGDSVLWNVATHGGGITILGNSVDTIRHCVFSCNIADKDSLSTGRGGAIHVDGAGARVITGLPGCGNIFTSNYAALGGAISLSAGLLSAKDNHFSSNRAAYFSGSGSGGAVYAEGMTATLKLGGNAALGEDNRFIRNTAGRAALPDSAHGGALSVLEGAHAEVFGNTFNDHNACSGKGGAVYIRGLGTRCAFGEYNEGPIEDFPFSSFQFGNIVQNNNRSLNDSVSLPILSWPADTTFSYPIPDSLLNITGLPDTTQQTLSLAAIAHAIPLQILPEYSYSPWVFLLVYEKLFGLKVVEASHPAVMMMKDTVRIKDNIAGYAAGNQRLALLLETGKLLMFGLDSLASTHKLVFRDTLSLPDSGFTAVAVHAGMVFLAHENEIFSLLPDDTAAVLTSQYTKICSEPCSYSRIISSGDRIYAISDYDSISEIQVFLWNLGELQPAGTFSLSTAEDIYELQDSLYVITSQFQTGMQLYSLKVLDCVNPWLITEVQDLSLSNLTQPVLSVFSDHQSVFLVMPGQIQVMDKASHLTMIYLLSGTQYLDLAGKASGNYLFGASPQAGLTSLNKNTLSVLDTIAPEPVSDLIRFSWPVILPFPPDTGWTTDIPVIPDTLVIPENPGKGSGQLSVKGVISMPLPVFPCSDPDSLITLDGGFMAIVDLAESSVLGNLIGGDRLEHANTASRNGGGIYVCNAGPVNVGDTNSPGKDYTNFIQGNVAGQGGGIYIGNHLFNTLVVTNNRIGGLNRHAGNHSGMTGGGIQADSSLVKINRNYIMNNSCGFDSVREFNEVLPGFGGGIMVFKPYGTEISENWITGNLSMGNAGGVGFGGPLPAGSEHFIFRNTFTENHAVDEASSWILRDTFAHPVGTGLLLMMNTEGIAALSPPFKVHHNLFDHMGILDAYAFAVDTFLTDTAVLDFHHNNVWCTTGLKYGGMTGMTGIQGNISLPPAWVDPDAGDYNMQDGSGQLDYGWNPSPSATGISRDTLRVPQDYQGIHAAMQAASYGDCILVDTAYQSAGDAFPITVKNGVNLSSIAFAVERDISLIRKVNISNAGGDPLLLLDGTGPRTIVRGFTLHGATTALSMKHAGGRIYSNVLHNNAADLDSEQDSAVSAGWKAMYIDHNTMTSDANFRFDTPEELTEPVYFRAAEGPVLSSNVFNQLNTNIDSLFPDSDSLRPDPWIIIGMAFNTGQENGYYGSLGWPNSGIIPLTDHGFVDSTGADFRLRDSSELIDLWRSNRFSGALYVRLRAIFSATDTLGFIPFTVQLTDSSTHHPVDSLSYHWESSLGQTSGVKNPIFLIDTAGISGFSLRIRDPYQSDYTARDSLIRSLPPGGAIHGYVYYDNIHKQLMDSVPVFLSDTAAGYFDTLVTSARGDYWASGLPAGLYGITAMPVCGPGGINMVDALLILRHYLNLDTLVGVRFKAADVNASGFINSIDALLVQRYFVGLINGFPAGPWVSEENTLFIPPLQNTLKANRTAVLSTGDPNGSFVP